TADIKVDEFLQKRLKEEFPNDQILSEETENTVTNYTGRVWIIDPLDGTKLFTDKIPYFSINVALCLNGIPILGVAGTPTENKIYFAEKNKGAFVKQNNKITKLSVSKVNEVSESILITNNYNKKRPFDYILSNFKVKEHLTRSAFGILLIASGKAELFIHPGHHFKKWDTCAPQIIVEEAGGKVTDLLGNSLNYKQKESIWKNSVVVSNGIIHDKVIDEIKSMKQLD
ncbi:MAG: hypothetical protein OQK82_05970, partial [Candidatus Pacearchaeota archaeon]|nr:hypothetical protein [Candidatus Pacearchaeota archaeon]